LETKRLLIIEEDRACRDALQQLFISRGWEVAMVTNETEGLSILHDYDPDWIVVPWDQLQGSGERFMTVVRGKPLTPRVALLTDSADLVSVTQASRLKTELRLRKPVVPEQLYRACDPGWDDHRAGLASRQTALRG